MKRYGYQDSGGVLALTGHAKEPVLVRMCVHGEITALHCMGLGDWEWLRVVCQPRKACLRIAEICIEENGHWSMTSINDCQFCPRHTSFFTNFVILCYSHTSSLLTTSQTRSPSNSAVRESSGRGSSLGEWTSPAPSLLGVLHCFGCSSTKWTTGVDIGSTTSELLTLLFVAQCWIDWFKGGPLGEQVMLDMLKYPPGFGLRCGLLIPMCTIFMNSIWPANFCSSSYEQNILLRTRQHFRVTGKSFRKMRSDFQKIYI